MNRDVTDLLRFAAMAAVLCIHGSGAEEAHLAFPDQSASVWAAGLFSQSLRWCVPFFMALSAYGLTRQALAGAARGESFRVADFYRRRFLRLIPPYLAFAFLYFAFTHPAARAAVAGPTISSLGGAGLAWLRTLPDGSACYHLYFLPALLLLTGAFPLFLKIPRSALLWIALPLCALAWSPFNRWIPALPTWVPWGWTGAFLLGIATAGIETPGSRRAVNAWTFVAALGLAWVLYEYAGRAGRGDATGLFNHFHRVSVMVFAAGAWMAVTTRFTGAAVRVPAKLAAWIPLAFPVYLIHPAFLHALESAGWFAFPFGWAAQTLALAALSLAATRLLDAAVPRGPWRAWIGLP